MKRAMIVLLLLAATGCGGGDRQGALGGAPLLSPAEAEGREGRVAVQGFLWARPGDGVFRICEAALESFPPQCGMPAIDVTGLDVTEIAGIDFSQNIFWADGVRARGELSSGRLDIEAVELNAKDDASGIAFRLVVPIETDGGGVDFVVLVTNSSPVPVSLTFPDGQSAEVVLRDPETNSAVFTWSDGRSFDQAVRTVSLEPGETRRYVLEQADLALAAGVYDLVAQLTASPAPPTALGRLVVR